MKMSQFFFQTTDNLDGNISSVTLGNTTSSPPLDSYSYSALISSIVLHCSLWPVVIISGILGNILSMFVLRKMEDSSITSRFLKSLTIADTVTLIVRCLQMVNTSRMLFWPQQTRAWEFSSFEFNTLSSISRRISKAITVAISVDRVVAVTMPMRYKIMCRPKRITVMISIMSIIITALALPTIVDLFMYRFQVREDKTIHTDFGQQYRVSKSKLKSFHLLINVLVFDFIPTPVVLICNVIIIVCLRKSNIKESTTSQVQQQRKQKERELTKLLLTISMLFLSLAGPLSISGVLIMTGALQEDAIVLDILLTLSLVNNSINFIVYAVMNKKYRQGYIEILCCCCWEHEIEECIAPSKARNQRQ